MERLSPRLQAVVDALPLAQGLRVLEIGCGPGAMARAIANRIGDGYVLAIDRSAKAVEQARQVSGTEIVQGRMSVLQCAAEDFVLPEGILPFDLAIAIRVGALDGRHPEAGVKAIKAIKAALKPDAKLYIDGGNPLLEIAL